MFLDRVRVIVSECEALPSGCLLSDGSAQAAELIALANRQKVKM